ncbi:MULTISPECIES: hypothetical protein [unclassified Pseudofrankia]|uniref:hypothetical protein n=1 Tax=unclassified Pseudofrankia TaxID=2994372 RepID=UPI000A73D64F|nr:MULTISPECIES: hypothetical protein [unclassified Pseudofrankia]MDT3444459.1 hypothetical protein [Pseudofrankia sp. BMG5.37]
MGLARWSCDPLLAPHTASVVAVLAACGRDLTVPLGEADAVLAALVRRARAGDLAAARVVLERLMPALTGQARRRCHRRGVSFDQLLVELVGSAWIVIRCYPVERRPVKVAANLVGDAVGLAVGYVPLVDRLTDPAGLTPRPGTSAPDAGDTSATASGAGGPTAAGELFAVLLDGRAAGIPAQRLRVLADLGVLGLSQQETAARAGVSERAVRARRDVAVEALRAELVPAGAVAS